MIHTPIYTDVAVVPDKHGVLTHMIARANETHRESCAVLNLSEAEGAVSTWKAALPAVMPFYPVAANDHPCLLETFSRSGCGFAVGSPKHAEDAIAAGAKPADILVVNKALSEHKLKRMFTLGVTSFCFDCECGLQNILACTPSGVVPRLLITIKTDKTYDVVNPYFQKNGATVVEARRLIRLCKKLGCNLVGFRFHSFSAYLTTEPYRAGLAAVAELAGYAASFGLKTTVVDIGGGMITPATAIHFSGLMAAKGVSKLPTIEECAETVMEGVAAVKVHAAPDLVLIAEPGNFLASDAQVVGVRVFTRRLALANVPEDSLAATEAQALEEGATISEAKYIVGDGIFGFYSPVPVRGATPHITVYDSHGSPITPRNGESAVKSTIFGPTCADCDMVMPGTQIPLLDMGDWIITDGLGTYSNVFASEFNGIPLTPLYPVRIAGH